MPKSVTSHNIEDLSNKESPNEILLHTNTNTERNKIYTVLYTGRY